MFVESPEPDGSEFRATPPDLGITPESAADPEAIPEYVKTGPENFGPSEAEVKAFNAEIAALQTKYEPALGRNVTIEISPGWWSDHIDQSKSMPDMRKQFEQEYKDFRAARLQLMLQQQAAGLPVKELSEPPQSSDDDEHKSPEK